MKLFPSAILLVLLLSLLGACGGAPATQSPTATAATAAPAPTTAPAAAAFPVTIENCGRSLTFEQPPERVISLWQPPTEMLLALGVQDRIVALAGNYTDLRPDLAPLAEGIKELGTAMAWPAREVLLSEQPDLVISEGLEGFAFDAAAGYATVAEIEATGAQVISTGGSCTPLDPASQSKSTETVYNDLLMLGQVFGVSERAEELVAELQAREAEVVAKVAGRDLVKVAFYNGGDGPVFVLSFGIWADLMAKAGGENVITTEGFQISNEEFAASQPEVILIGVYPGQEAEDRIAFLKATFPTVPAVQNDRLYPIPTIDTEASVRVIDGLEQIARALHPEAFE
jgi:iron complex transport system substrate-binding protein